jgi:hypothetical protein
MNQELYDHLQFVLFQHHVTCPLPTRGILLHPTVAATAGFEAVHGIPIIAREEVPEKAVRIDCEGSSLYLDEELKELLATPIEV